MKGFDENIKKVDIEFVPHEKQRFAYSIGDYFIENDKNMKINISQTKDWRHQWLVAIHEMVEVLLVIDRRIKLEDIESFDDIHQNEDEQGDNPIAPYHKEHMVATAVEKLLCKELRTSFDKYEADTLKIKKGEK